MQHRSAHPQQIPMDQFPAQPLLQVDRLTKLYGDPPNQTHALREVSFTVLRGEMLGIMGPSGSGKTTLLNCLSTMIRPTAGLILLEGNDIAAFKDKDLADHRGRRIGYLFQQFELLDNLTALENILLPLHLHGISGKEAKIRVDALARLLSVQDSLSKFPTQLSGGQKQRVAAARALITDPDIVLADEPTGALDSVNAAILMQKLAYINQHEQRTILIVTHDPGVAAHCSRILFILDGKIHHELRRALPNEAPEEFADRIRAVTAQLEGGLTHAL